MEPCPNSSTTKKGLKVTWTVTLKVDICNFIPTLYLAVWFPLHSENKIKASITLIQYIMLRYERLHSFWWKESGDRNRAALPEDKIIMLNVCIILIKMITLSWNPVSSGRSVQMQNNVTTKKVIMCLCYRKPCSLHTVIVFHDFVPTAQSQFPFPMMAYVS